MALIEERKKERITSGSYERVFGNKELGSLISMVHSTSISNGNELEKIILNKCKKVVKDAKELNSILQKEFDDSWDVIIVPKKVIKNSSIKNSSIKNSSIKNSSIKNSMEPPRYHKHGLKFFNIITGLFSELYRRQSF
ncbi:Pseudogene of Alkylphosphonate ABC transporter, permease component [Mycoplasma mycoides subsp. capri LC str. 95010]|uniref:hypothetical protein n=1 Tax=Mycoplasma mycoides TaxID=2102 RepID=UPI0002059AE5|nr:hypothetical protein [Mycoplasma mycoides]CBW54508.1 Pseudogene of Alkylphosphonate ABC transporter, permease component [Mycoplasma mycoides subsp. capri LC str. 95010]